MNVTYYADLTRADVAARRHVLDVRRHALTLTLSNRKSYALTDVALTDYSFLLGFFERESVETVTLQQLEHENIVMYEYDGADVYQWLCSLDPQTEPDHDNTYALPDEDDAVAQLHFVALFRSAYLVEIDPTDACIVCLSEKRLKDVLIAHRHLPASGIRTAHVYYDDHRFIRNPVSFDAAQQRLREIPFL